MGHTVISIPGGFALSVDKTKFGGHVWNEAVNTVLPTGIWQNWSVSDSAAVADMNQLYDMIIDNIDNDDDGVIVIGHSRGGQIIYKLFRDRYGDLAANVDPSRILFISSGNPERKYGGACVNNTLGDPPTYPGKVDDVYTYGVGYGLPAWSTGDFTMLDIARQYDRFADYPNNIHSTVAVGNISTAIHTDYTTGVPHLGTDGLPVDWDEWAVHVEGNVTYLTSHTMLVDPNSYPVSWLARVFGGRCLRQHNQQIGFDDARRRTPIEAAYERPAPVLIPQEYR